MADRTLELARHHQGHDFAHPEYESTDADHIGDVLHSYVPDAQPELLGHVRGERLDLELLVLLGDVGNCPLGTHVVENANHVRWLGHELHE